MLRLVGPVSIALLAGCGLGRLVQPDEPLGLGERDGVIAIAIESPGPTRLGLCRDADLGACMTTGAVADASAVHLYVAPAGRYCLLMVYFEPHSPGTIEHAIAADHAECFDVTAGTIVYPGDLVVEAHPLEGIWWRVRQAWVTRPDFAGRLAARYPALTGLPIGISAPTRRR